MDTPFKDILHTNAVPSNAECQRIHELLLDPREEAAALTVEIERLQALISQLTQKRAHLNEFIDAHTALMSPVRRLPADVVLEVFTVCLPAGRNSIMSGEEAPLLLCHICREWRHLALSTPCLWASLHIVAPPNVSKTDRLIEAVNTWLSRSGVLPLSISLVRAPDRDPEADFSMLVAALVQYSSRWKRMRLRLDPDCSFKQLKTLSPADVPMLESIDIDGYPMEQEDGQSALSFLGSLSLHSVTLRHMTTIIILPLPWNQLRHLSLAQNPAAWFTAAEGIELLQRCPNLETCTLPLWTGQEIVPPTTLTCRMEQMRQLSVVDGWEATTDFFQNIDLPSLRSLEYSATSVDGSFFIPVTSRNHLQSLSFRMDRVMSETIIECLRLVPALRELVICDDFFTVNDSPDSSVDSEVWNSLTPTTHNLHDVLCPALSTVNFIRFDATSDTMLLKFIQARTESHFPGISQLSKVHVHFSRPVQVDIVPELQLAVDDGLDLSLTYPAPSPGYSPLYQILAPPAAGELLWPSWIPFYYGFTSSQPIAIA
ncbi:hypothetical protein B0H19DRAFT_1142455 [Mycena capillaripes]|nr:hypothetical protein B0H19DRAFT_1142455 [Mycena capillaripes]